MPKTDFWFELCGLLSIVLGLVGGGVASMIVFQHHPDAWVWPTLFVLGQLAFVVATLLGVRNDRRKKKTDPKVLTFALAPEAVRGIAEIKRLQENWSDQDVVTNSLSCYHKCLLLSAKGRLVWLSDDTTEERNFSPIGD